MLESAGIFAFDERRLDHSFAGARMLRPLLRREGVSIGRRHVATLMKRIGIAAIRRRPNASKPAYNAGRQAQTSNDPPASASSMLPDATGQEKGNPDDAGGA